MPMIPPTVTAQEHKVTVSHGKPIFYDPPEVRSAKAKLTAYLSQHKPDKPYKKGVRLKDCMTVCGFWTDDALVASEICEKFWAANPGIYIKVEVLK